MKRFTVLFSMLLVVVWSGAASANSAPVVSNVTVSQRTDGSKKVDIRYNLSDADGDRCTVSVQVSGDDGATWTVPAVSFTGAIGPNISPGTGKLITWDCAADLPGAYGTNYRVKVIADDGYTPPVPADMVLIPGGQFQMGDNLGDGSSAELPVHTVTVDSFYMAKYEISNRQYCDYLNSANSQGLITVTSGVVYKAGSGTSYSYCATSTSSSYSQIAYSGGVFSVRSKGGRSMVNDPMVQVSWYGAAAYSNWRSQQGGRELCYNLSTWNCDFSKNGYRLATEAEWEYAARGGLAGKRFPWGDDIYHTQANYSSSSYYSYDKGPTRGYHPLWNDGIEPYTSPVGFFDGTMKHKMDYNWPGSATSYQTTRGANNYGLYDMAGNVWEWCNDWWQSDYYGSSPYYNPPGPTSGSSRVLRGACWYTNAGTGCVAYRTTSSTPDIRHRDIGFRCVLDTAVADTGSALSGRFTIDNRSGSGFRVTSLTSSYTGVFPEGVDVINTFTATVDWSGKTPSKVVFELNDTAYDVSPTGDIAVKTFNMGDDLLYSRGGAKNELIVYAVGGDGAMSGASQLNLWGLELPEWAISLDSKVGPINYKLDPTSRRLTFSGKVELLKNDDVGGMKNIDDDIPLIGGDYGVMLDPLTFDWELAAKAQSGGAGLAGTFALRNGQWGAHAAFGKDEKDRTAEVSATFSGSGEFYPRFRLADISGGFNASCGPFDLPKVYLLCATPLGGCYDPWPYGYLSLSAGISGELKMEEGEPALFAGLRFKQDDPSWLQMEILVKGMVGADAKWLGEAEGGIGGKPTIILQFPGNPDSSCASQYIKSIKFVITLEASGRVLWWEKEWNRTFDIFECPTTKAMQLMAAEKTAADAVPRLLNRDYLLAPEGYCVFPSKNGVIGLLTVGGLPEPILNVGSMSTPSVAATSDNGLLVFVYDDASKPVGKHQEIYFARWNGSQWTGHAPVTENINPDIHPAAAIDAAGTEIAVWMTAPEPTGLEEGPRDVLGGFDIAWSKYDPVAGNWRIPVKLTDNGYVDAMPRFEKSVNGDLRAVWMAGPTNAIPVWDDEEIDPVIDLMGADWNATTFGAPYTIASELATASLPAVCRTETHEILAYLKDHDHNTATREDLEVVLRMRPAAGQWGEDYYLTADSTADVSVDIAVDEGGTPVVVWTKRMTPHGLPDGNETTVDQVWFSAWVNDSWMIPKLAFECSGVSEPTFFRNETGKIVLFWTGLSAEFWDIYYSVYDSELMRWGLPQQITHDQGAETMLSLAESGGNILAGYVKRRIDLSDANGLPKIGLSDIYLLEHIPAKDLFISPNDISVSVAPNLKGLAGFCSYWLDEGCGEPNGWCLQADLDHSGTVDFNDYSLFVRDNGLIAEICADVHLSGDFIVEDVNVSFYDGDPNSDTLIGSEIIDTILPGQAKQAKVKWHVPGDKQMHHIYVVVDPNNEIPETDDIGNNKAYVTLFKPDVKAESIAVLGYPGSEAVVVGFTVKNIGSADAGPSTCKVVIPGRPTKVIYTGDTALIQPGESATVQFAWDVTSQSPGTYGLVVIADANNVIDESDEGNNAVSGQVPVLPDLEAMQWSGRIEGGMAYITIRNVGAKPSQSTIVRVTCEGSVLGEQAVGALNPGDSMDVSISISEPWPGARVEITVNPDSSGSDEVSLLNNTAIVLL